MAFKRNYLAMDPIPYPTPLTHLRGQHNEGDAYHDDHVELRGPDVRHKVTVTHRGEGHNHIVSALKEV